MMIAIGKKLCAALVCAVVLTAMLPLTASALSAGVYTASVVTTYYNPDTGEVDDGGTANAASERVCAARPPGTTALVESDGTNTWVTIRFFCRATVKMWPSIRETATIAIPR